MKAKLVLEQERHLLLILAISAVSTVYYKYKYILHSLIHSGIHAFIPWIQKVVKMTIRHEISLKSTRYTIQEYCKYSNTVLKCYMKCIIYS
jgi:hypothetical protein